VATAVVVDASVAVKWLLPEVGSEQALALARRWAREGVTAVAPALLWLEVSNVLHQRVRAGELGTGDAARLLEGLAHLGLERRSEVSVYSRAVHMASELGLTNTYDAVYLALAESEEAEFWTGDGGLYTATRGRLQWVHSLAEVG